MAGTLNSTAGSYFRIELFASPTPDATSGPYTLDVTDVNEAPTVTSDRPTALGPSRLLPVIALVVALILSLKSHKCLPVKK